MPALAKSTHRTAAKPAAPAWRERLRKALRSTFRIASLRDGQLEVIERVMEGRHTLAIMPTGAGKSLCYQAPAVLLAGRTLVVSPLIALMKDQCDKLLALGVKAVQLNSSLSAADAHAADAAVLDGTARIIFTTPERLADAEFVDLIERHPVSLLVIDEAHCMSQWGHDFRPAFLEIGPALRKLGSPTVLALTATATNSVIEDIREQLHLAHLAVLNTGIYRDNLHYRVDQLTREDEKLDHLLQLVQAQPGSGMVYAATVKAVEQVHQALLDAGVAAVRYHGKLAAGERRANQDSFMRNEARVMVATNAFGLGIDTPDTRFVIHYLRPWGLTGYYQESGRAGRDGQ
ncbi:MAG: recombinase RecQ, partial [Rhizobacter sp.]|nr:recombinase RecQ [Rhizobacter sp.]